MITALDSGHFNWEMTPGQIPCCNVILVTFLLCYFNKVNRTVSETTNYYYASPHKREITIHERWTVPPKRYRYYADMVPAYTVQVPAIGEGT